MPNHSEITKWATDSIAVQAESIERLGEQLSADFSEAVNHILESKGRVIVTGIGKSANIAAKIVATLNSTGTPALFMHAADAVHGDLGMVLPDDVIICISKSGNTPEIQALIPLIKMAGNVLIGIVGNLNSRLAEASHYVLNATVQKEACPNNLAPTASTSAQLVMGDALAVCLLRARGFTSRDFAKYHPGGALGKKLYTTMQDLASMNPKPEINEQATINEVIVELTKNRLGAAAVIKENKVVGIVTDGDIRRMIEKHQSHDALRASDIMGKNPIAMDENELAIEGSKLMFEKKISQIIVTSKGKYSGMVHIHDLNREGLLG